MTAQTQAMSGDLLELTRSPWRWEWVPTPDGAPEPRPDWAERVTELFEGWTREGLERLHQHPNTDVVLLDIMMPEMDGYQTARAIRAMPRFEHLPIISLTAKAMKGDREKAIAAGASDYITKPVDVDQLLSMMRVWLGA